MGKVTGFLEIEREDSSYKPVKERIKHFKEFTEELDKTKLSQQGARCMDCGIPYCHTGCPVNNIIPDWNDLVYNNEWEEAIKVLHSTNNFPEFTGRICPAPCEASCTLNLDDKPVTIKSIERSIIDNAWKSGFIKPEIAKIKTSKQIAIIGSGPAGMSASQQLLRVGHEVHLYEKNENLLPTFKEHPIAYTNAVLTFLLNVDLEEKFLEDNEGWKNLNKDFQCNNFILLYYYL